ncbi:hypothetical protein CsSME_00013591 [Camellia sinensis var. sinensis]
MVVPSIPTVFAYSPNQIPIFGEEYYDYWSSQMKTIFISQDLWEIVESTYPEPPPARSSYTWNDAQQKLYKENVKKDASALQYIQ